MTAKHVDGKLKSVFGWDALGANRQAGLSASRGRAAMLIITPIPSPILCALNCQDITDCWTKDVPVPGIKYIQLMAPFCNLNPTSSQAPNLDNCLPNISNGGLKGPSSTPPPRQSSRLDLSPVLPT